MVILGLGADDNLSKLGNETLHREKMVQERVRSSGIKTETP